MCNILLKGSGDVWVEGSVAENVRWPKNLKIINYAVSGTYHEVLYNFFRL